MANSITKAFGLNGEEGWLRHSNPASVWTRFAVLPLLALSIWSRDWIGWWSLVPLALSLIWLGINPLFFAKPATTTQWASRSVLGERLWTEADRATFPPQFRSQATNVALGFQVLGLVPLVYGLVVLDPIAVVTGVVIVQLAKLWYLDRMVLLYDTTRQDA